MSGWSVAIKWSESESEHMGEGEVRVRGMWLALALCPGEISSQPYEYFV